MHVLFYTVHMKKKGSRNKNNPYLERQFQKKNEMRHDFYSKHALISPLRIGRHGKEQEKNKNPFEANAVISSPNGTYGAQA